ncbi:penicillin-binding transpeptidase domain-containing protein [Cellulomonas composti]|uniref:Beta-lactamase n=1 Tax=Cellulomonas composti TaxID=266130 RepID=A0A511JDF0_9CELL|nr:penicillin-binding transpeptidase domain-containing protein [Cellulomonas composti]GEL96004.1 cell division protein FtsI [Cellulomonas composti]
MRRRAWLGAAVIGASAALAGACTDSPPGPDEAAADLASALRTGTFENVELVGTTTAAAAAEARTAAYAGMGDREVDVTVREVSTDPDDEAAATVSLAYSWDLDPDVEGDEWEYVTTAHLERTDDEWRAQWRPAILAPDLVADEVLRVVRESAPRANVLGAGDEVLVEARPVHRIGIDKTRVEAADAPAAATALATALGLDPDAYAARVAAAGDKAFVEAIVVRDGDPAYDVAELSAMDGVNAIAAELPLAPTRTFARAILGTVGEATAEIIDDSGGDVAAGDLTGLSGLERQYDEQLRGRPGLSVQATSDGGPVRSLFTVDAVAGTPLRLTLDADLQTAGEQVLAGVGPASALVAIQPSSGNVLAAASGPGGDGMSTATLGQYAPGSTFKVVSALALLRAGLSPESTVQCPAQAVVDGRAFDNFPDYPADRLGEVSLRTAFANSCNTAFISLREEVGQDAILDAAASLGLTAETALGYPAFLGAVPAESDGTDHAATLIGQGRVLASPLGMAVVAASVARGATVTPRLVVGTGSADDDGSDEGAGTESGDESDDATAADPASSTSARPQLPLTDQEAAALRELMGAVVSEGGASFLADEPVATLAKTGTAQFGPVDDLRNHAWIIAVQGDLAVAVFVDEGEYGSTTAGPLLEEFLEAARNLGGA